MDLRTLWLPNDGLRKDGTLVATTSFLRTDMFRILGQLSPALRALLRRPGFALPAVLTLAAGLGAATAVFSLANGVLLTPLPFEDSQRIVGFWSPGSWSQAELDFLRDEAQSYESVGAFYTDEAVYRAGDEPRVVDLAAVSPDLLDVLKISTLRGRLFARDEELPGNDAVVVLGERFWKRELGGDPDVIGKTIDLSDQPMEIIGIVPAGGSFPTPDTELWVPLTIDRNSRNYGGGYYLSVLGRLRAETTLDAARKELELLVPRQQEKFNLESGFDKLAETPTVEPYLHQITGAARTPLLMLAAASFLLLLVACANVAHLMLARATQRSRELAIRGSVGASTRDLMTQLLAEAIWISVTAGATGLLIADRGLALLRTQIPVGSPRLEEVALDPTAFGVGLAITLVTVMIFGLLPAVRWSQRDLRTALGAGRGQSAGPNKLRWALVAGEMALAAWLTTMAISTGQTVIELISTDSGFSADNVVTVRPELSGKEWSDPAQRVAFYERIFERLDSVPGVTAAGANWRLPIAETGAYQRLEIEGRPATPGDPPPSIYWRAIAGDYFEAMGIPLLAGRVFDSRDTAEHEQVGIINTSTANRFWPGASALGKRLQNSMDGSKWVTIVGVVGDVRHEALADEAGFTIYRPYAQGPQFIRTLTVVVAGLTAPEALLPEVRDAIRDEFPMVPVHREATMSSIVSRSIARERLTGITIAFYGGMALALAMLGVFGLLSYTVADRRRELGIRLALGAETWRIVWMVVRQGMAPAVAGASFGLLVSFGLGRWLASILYGINAFDPWSHLAVLLVLCVTALVACALPAMRAARFDPTTILRED